jgi:hypothetical protein
VRQRASFSRNNIRQSASRQSEQHPPVGISHQSEQHPPVGITPRYGGGNVRVRRFARTLLWRRFQRCSRETEQSQRERSGPVLPPHTCNTWHVAHPVQVRWSAHASHLTMHHTTHHTMHMHQSPSHRFGSRVRRCTCTPITLAGRITSGTRPRRLQPWLKSIESSNVTELNVLLNPTDCRRQRAVTQRGVDMHELSCMKGMHELTCTSWHARVGMQHARSQRDWCNSVRVDDLRSAAASEPEELGRSRRVQMEGE